MFYTIGEAAEKVGVAPSALRYYDKEGLLPFVERSGGGIRMFKDSDMEWLRLIECLKKTQMPIKEIKQFIEWCGQGDATIPLRLELIKRQKQAVLDEISALNNTLEMLEYKEWYYTVASEAGTCAVHENLTDEQIPPKFAKFRSKK